MTVGTFGAKPSHESRAKNLAELVRIFAVSSVLAEASVVPVALLPGNVCGRGEHVGRMSVPASLGRAFAGGGVGGADGNLVVIVLVKERALVAFLAVSLQPLVAYGVVHLGAIKIDLRVLV